MKKVLSELLLTKIKADFADMYLEFFAQMRHDLDLDGVEYISHFGNLGDILFKIDSAKTIMDLNKLHSEGDLDLAGEDFSEFIYDMVLRLDKENEGK